MDIACAIVFGNFLGNLRQSEKLSHVKQPLQKYSTTYILTKNLLLVDPSPPNSTTEVTMMYSFPSAFNNK